MLIFFCVTFIVLLISQVIGFEINQQIKEYSSVRINEFIYFTHIRNHGGIFGFLQGKGWLFAIFSTILLVAMAGYLWVSEQISRAEYICFGLIAGGGASNVLDRLIYGSVIDFIDIQHIPFWNYIFNTADVCVHLGIWPLIFLSLRNGGEAGSREREQ
jgi:signal peptidase II